MGTIHLRREQNPAVQALMKKIDKHLLPAIIELRQQCVPLLHSPHEPYGVVRNTAELTSHRARLFARDDRCYFCSCELQFNATTLDHLLPKCRGGDDSDENLVLCCDDCNTAKGSLTEEEFREALVCEQPSLPR